MNNEMIFDAGFACLSRFVTKFKYRINFDDTKLQANDCIMGGEGKRAFSSLRAIPLGLKRLILFHFGYLEWNSIRLNESEKGDDVRIFFFERCIKYTGWRM